ncbi:hypothetical protein N9047_01305 [bacterium]|nr:hypothetical protein [bacterium]
MHQKQINLLKKQFTCLTSNVDSFIKEGSVGIQRERAFVNNWQNTVFLRQLSGQIPKLPGVYALLRVVRSLDLPKKLEVISFKTYRLSGASTSFIVEKVLGKLQASKGVADNLRRIPISDINSAFTYQSLYRSFLERNTYLGFNNVF